MTAVFWALGAVWCAFSLISVLANRGVRPLPGLDELTRDSPPAPHVSIVIAARNEERRIGDTVERLLRQRGVEVELIVVDDRSTDGTPAILDRLDASHGALRVLRVDELPAGWLGKPHACHAAANLATGDWLLFTDADAWMGPDLVARALRTAVRDGAAHLSVFPGEEHTSLAARAALTLIMSATAPVPALVNRDHPLAAVGVGAFNLVRADAYRASGGYEALRMEVIDDLKLGLLLRKSGFRARVYDASRDMKIHWAGDLPGLIRAVEKNMFALFAFNVPLATLGMILPLALWAATLLAPFASGPAAWVPLAGMATAWIPGLIVARRGRLGVAAALLSPLAVPVLVAMIFHSTVKTLRQGGIRWRTTFYPLAELRRGRVKAI